MGIIYYNTIPTNAQLGDTWWDTSYTPALQKVCTSISPLTFVLVGQQKTLISRFIPTSGSTVTIPDNVGDIVVVIAPATDLAALTLAWPSTPYDGQSVRIVSTKNITTITHTGASLNRSIPTILATGDMNFVYDAGGSTYMCDGVSTLSQVVTLPFTATTAGGAGNAVFFPTDTGLVGGNALFASIQRVQPLFDVADPLNAFAKPVISNANKTITTNCQKLNTVTLLSTLLTLSTTSNSPNGVVLSFLVSGILV